MTRQVLLAGVGMAPFVAPGHGDAGALAASAVRMAMGDAALDSDLIDLIHVACVHGGAGIGERLLAPLDLTGIGLFNFSDGCAAGHDAFHLARQSLLAGENECALVVGCEVMPVDISCHAFFGLQTPAQHAAMHLPVSSPQHNRLELRQQPAELFAAQARYLQTEMGLSENTLQQVLVNARQRAHLNPYALLAESAAISAWQAPYLAPAACGAAALLLCTMAFARRYGVRADIACLASLRGAGNDDWQETCGILDVLGRATTRRIADEAYSLTGLGPDEIDVVELHDQSTADYLINTTALRFCNEDQLDAFARDAHGRTPAGTIICPSGGLLGRGHAPGATAIAQLVELVWQLRGQARGHQVAQARTAMQHSTTLGRAVALTLLQRL